MLLFTVASLSPIPLIWAAAVFGSWASLAAPLYMTVVVLLLDEKITRPAVIGDDDDVENADHLSKMLALGHFITLGLTVAALGANNLGPLEKLGLFIAAGQYFGQVSNSNAHELIHRSSRVLHFLGKWIYISLLFGHHTSAHSLVHHRYVATDMDPNSARLGESFYHFAVRAWKGSFIEGYKAESLRRQQAGKMALTNPYISYVGGAVLFIAVAFWIGGLLGAVLYLLLAGNAQMQLLLSDYVQHYGLSREIDENGKPEPVKDTHSWNTPHWFSSGLMLNAPRHSHHHSNPSTPYPLLELGDGPMLPRSLPAMAAIALVPNQWRKIMDPRVAALRAQHAPA